MKLFFIFCILYCGPAFSQSTIYDLDVQTPDGNIIKFSNYKGQKILIVSMTADNLTTKNLNFWDSLQRSNSPLVVVLIPANDLGKPVDDSTIKAINGNLSKNLILSASVQVKKAEGQSQDPILQWLTHSDQNAHFNTDVTTNEQIYVVSESGVLYAVLENGVPVTVIDQVLKQQDVTQ
jgi:glutathione peroxidase-family protein